MQRFAPVYDSLRDPAYHQKDGPRFFSYRQLLDPPTYVGKGPNRVEVDRMTAALGQLRFGRAAYGQGKAFGARPRQR